jgi:quaternary ammonium compound-resistance protein SugE
MNPWIYLIIAGVFEIGFTTCLKKGAETSANTWVWNTAFLICAIISFSALEKAIEYIPIGTAYAVWTGIGAIGTVIIGILFFGESKEFLRLLFIVTLVGSIIGLKVVSK